MTDILKKEKHFEKVALVNFFQGDEDILIELVKSFTETYDVNLINLEESITNLDYILWERSAHTLKSMLKTVQSNELAEICSELECLGRDEGNERIGKEKLESLRPSLIELIAELSLFLEQLCERK